MGLLGSPALLFFGMGRVLEGLCLQALWIALALQILLPSAADPDLWGHVLFGQRLLHGELPMVNGLAYTAADHPWINHELAAEAAMAATYRAAGPAGLIALKVLLALASLGLVWRSARRRSGDAWAATIATIAAAEVMAPGFMIRPQLFTLLFLALTCELLARAEYRARAWAWGVPPLVVLWVNTHGGVLAGVGLSALAIVAGLTVPAWRRELGAGAFVAAATFLAALAAALTMNPFGPALPRFLLSDVTPRVAITEWAPVSLGDGSVLAFKAMALATGAWMLVSRRARLPEAVLVIVTAGAAVLHRRHIPLFAIVAAPVLAALLADAIAWARRHADIGRSARLLRPALVTATALQLAVTAAIAWRSGGRIEVDPRIYPVQALGFLTENGIAGNVALPFDWGELGLWALPAGSKVAVDGRFTTAYPERLLEQAWRFMSGAPGWEDLLTQYPTDVVVASRTQAPARLLREHPDWEYVYSDPVSFVFLRKGPTQAATLARFHAHAFRYDAPPIALEFPALARADVAAQPAIVGRASESEMSGSASELATAAVLAGAGRPAPPSSAAPLSRIRN